MVSREMEVHAVVSLVGIGMLVVSAMVLDVSVWWEEALAIAVFYAVVFGGTHVYFVLRGGGGDYSMTARKRVLALLAVLFALLPAAVLVGDRALGPIPLRAVLTVAIGLAVIWYFVAEGIAGYRASVAED